MFGHIYESYDRTLPLALKANKGCKDRRRQWQEKWNSFEPCLQELVLQGKMCTLWEAIFVESLF